MEREAECCSARSPGASVAGCTRPRRPWSTLGVTVGASSAPPAPGGNDRTRQATNSSRGLGLSSRLPARPLFSRQLFGRVARWHYAGEHPYGGPPEVTDEREEGAHQARARLGRARRHQSLHRQLHVPRSGAVSTTPSASTRCSAMSPRQSRPRAHRALADGTDTEVRSAVESVVPPARGLHGLAFRSGLVDRSRTSGSFPQPETSSPRSAVPP